jgi:hypothetical protein
MWLCGWWRSWTKPSIGFSQIEHSTHGTTQLGVRLTNEKQSLVAVAVVALLIPFPWSALLSSIIDFGLWFFLPCFFVLICDSLGKDRAASTAAAVLVGVGSYFLVGPI